MSSVMSAMVSQIAYESQNSQMTVGSQKSTAAESLEDLFSFYEDEVAILNNLKQRTNDNEEFVQQPLKGILSTNINVFETYDTSSNPILTLPSSMVDENKVHAEIIAQREREASKHLVQPGAHRYMMPEVPMKSLRLRNHENPQFYPFSTLPIEDAERTMQLKALQGIIKGNGIDEGLKSKERHGRHKIFERKYDQYLDE